MERTSSSPKQSHASRYSELSVDEQCRRWEQRCQKASEIVSFTFETVRESGDVFPQEELYPMLPLLAANIWITALGFSPQNIVESGVMTEALFERLPTLASALGSQQRDSQKEFAHTPA